jgi:hypothetical protein
VNRNVLAAVGVAVAAVGFVLLAFPELARSLTTGQSFLYGVGAVAFFYGLHVASERYGADIEGYDPAVQEAVQDLPAPGFEFERKLDLAREKSQFDNREIQLEVRDELEAIAVEIVARRQGCPPAEARRRLVTGEWTDHEPVAAFFTESGARMTGMDLLKVMAGRHTSFAERVGRTVDELVRLWDGDQAPAAADNDRPAAADGGQEVER